MVFSDNKTLTHKNSQVKSNIMMSKCFKLLNLVANSQDRQGFFDTKTLRAAVSVSSYADQSFLELVDVYTKRIGQTYKRTRINVYNNS